MFHKIVLLCVWSFATPLAYGRPDQVIIIRHGEKPEQGDDLTVKGRERAAALAPFFSDGDHRPGGNLCPVASDEHHSRRSVETVTPLARELKLSVKTCDQDDSAEMVKEILAKPEYDGKVVLICWSHKAIPGLATALGVADPPVWHGHVYDRLWIIGSSDGKATLQDLPQRLHVWRLGEISVRRKNSQARPSMRLSDHGDPASAGTMTAITARP